LTPHPSLVYICSICGKVARGLRPVVCTVCRAPAEKFELLKPQDIETLAQKEGGLTEEITFDGVKLKWTQEAKTEFIRIQDGYLRRRALAQLEKAARMRGLSVISKELMSEFVGRVMSDKENPIQVTPHVAVENEVASPLPLPQKWEKMSSPSTLEQLGNFQWTEEALSRLSRVPSGFMRDNTRLKIEEYAKEKGIVNINLEVAEAGIARARELMAEMISGYSSGKK
ncbi:MAG: hypothetical protein HY399_00620, partial [Elusimicrobia bacterium]|nr:hypothetical protein [Elusimicrobiota bacterium]